MILTLLCLLNRKIVIELSLKRVSPSSVHRLVKSDWVDSEAWGCPVIVLLTKPLAQNVFVWLSARVSRLWADLQCGEYYLIHRREVRFPQHLGLLSESQDSLVPHCSHCGGHLKRKKDKRFRQQEEETVGKRFPLHIFNHVNRESSNRRQWYLSDPNWANWMEWFLNLKKKQTFDAELIWALFVQIIRPYLVRRN